MAHVSDTKVCFSSTFLYDGDGESTMSSCENDSGYNSFCMGQPREATFSFPNGSCSTACDSPPTCTSRLKFYKQESPTGNNQVIGETRTAVASIIQTDSLSEESVFQTKDHNSMQIAHPSTARDCTSWTEHSMVEESEQNMMNVDNNSTHKVTGGVPTINGRSKAMVSDSSGTILAQPDLSHISNIESAPQVNYSQQLQSCIDFGVFHLSNLGQMGVGSFASGNTVHFPNTDQTAFPEDTQQLRGLNRSEGDTNCTVDGGVPQLLTNSWPWMFAQPVITSATEPMNEECDLFNTQFLPSSTYGQPQEYGPGTVSQAPYTTTINEVGLNPHFTSHSSAFHPIASGMNQSDPDVYIDYGTVNKLEPATNLSQTLMTVPRDDNKASLLGGNVLLENDNKFVVQPGHSIDSIDMSKKWHQNETKPARSSRSKSSNRLWTKMELTRNASKNKPLNQAASSLMERWFYSHIDHPYPSVEEKERLAQLGGITVQQVSSWFANRRTRTANTRPKKSRFLFFQRLQSVCAEFEKVSGGALRAEYIEEKFRAIVTEYLL